MLPICAKDEPLNKMISAATKANDAACYFECGFAEADNFDPGTWTPLPAALPLFATGLGALGLLGWRRKRKSAAPIATA
jgi:hypothetical protein